MTKKYSSFKNHQLITENWRKYLAEEEPPAAPTGTLPEEGTRSGDPRDGHNRAYYDSFNPGSIKPTEQMLHKNKDGTYSIVIRLDYNQGVVLWGKMIEGEDFIFVDKVVKSYYVPSGQNP